jgi:Lhr-like helicase
MTQLLFPDGNNVTHTTKEAVASAILHQTYDRLRGAGPTGRIIYREKPSRVIHTQHILPRRQPSTVALTYAEKDDVTSPVHVGTVGLTFQIAARTHAAITVGLKACIYLRMLPSPADLSAAKVVFRLSKNARSVILRHRREALKRAEDENRAVLGDEGRKSPQWLEIKNRATEEAETNALLELGITGVVLQSPTRQDVLVSMLAEGDEEPTSDDPAVEEEPGTTADASEQPADGLSDTALDADEQTIQTTGGGDGDTLKAFEFAVAPGDGNAPPDALIEREQIPQKWLRVPVDLGAFRIDLSRSASDIDRDLAAFNAEMVRRVETVIDAWQADADQNTGGLLWGFPGGRGTQSRTIIPADVVEWDQTLAGLRTNRRLARPTIIPVLEYENLEDPLRPDERTVRIILANESDLLDAKLALARETDSTLYQVEMSVGFDPGVHRPIRLDRIAPSYRYNRYLAHDALGINCGVRRRGLTDPTVLETTSLPVYYQPLIRQFDLSTPPNFDALGSKDGGLAVVEGLLSAFDDWLKEIEEAKPYGRSLDPVEDARDFAREKSQFESIDLPGWVGEREAIARGVRILEKAVAAQAAGKAATDPEVIPLTAWRFMNRAFGEFWKEKNKSVEGWRLFQIAFILAQIPAIVSRIECWKDSPAVTAKDDREASLLYFSTGGGKSESFFGLLVFCLAFDRLRGKQHGVTSLVRYPLRLLTSQQAQRLSQVLAAAHKVRWSWQRQGVELKGADFDIGFWVGGGNTPNNRNVRGFSEIPTLADDWDEVSRRRGDYSIYLKKWVRLASCPYCSARLTGADGKKTSTIGLRRFREGPPPEERLAHCCFNRQCPWNLRHQAIDAPHPLPIHIMDSDIYAYAPAVLLGTVDKLALIGQSARTLIRVLGMFGFAAWQHRVSGRLVSPWLRDQFQRGPDTAGCQGVFPFYNDGKKLFFDPYPILEIQDEAHLLDESLGTFSGLFETTFLHALRTLSPLLGDQVVKEGSVARPPRIIAASATVSDPARQIDQIYQRQVVLFPQPGPDLYESFYARLRDPDSDDPVRDASDNAEHRTPTRRRYVSLMTNGRTHTAATVAILSAFHLTITQVLKGLIEGDEARRWAIREALADGLPADIFREGHRATLLDRNGGHAEIAYAVDLDRIALLYVTNKKGGDNVKAALQDVIRRDHKLAGIDDIPGVRTALITGAIDAGLINAIVAEAGQKPKMGSPFKPEALRDSLRGVIATSAISHGVDVDEFNMMFFAGQPSDIAEYIQASSRVGRTHVGTSILIPTPQQRRDRYIVEIHDIFHRFLERMIDAAPVERWAENAITRTLASFLQLKICGVDYIREMSRARTNAQRAALAEPDKVGEIGERSRTDHINLLDELCQFVVDGIGLEHDTSPLNKDFYRKRINQLFHDATTAMEQSNWRTENLDSFFRQPGAPLNRPMTSLRDVNEAGSIEGGLGSGSDSIRKADLGRVMSALMRGNNSWTAGATGE